MHDYASHIHVSITCTETELTKYLSKINTTQKSVLEVAFEANNWYLEPIKLTQLAQQTGLNERRIYLWFKNRRGHLRREWKKRKNTSIDKKRISDIDKRGTYTVTII